MIIFRIVSIVLFFLVFLSACRTLHLVQYELNSKVVEYPVVEGTAIRHWKVSNQALPLDKQALNRKGFHSTLVLQDNKIIFEWYADRFGQHSEFNIKSISKSFLSALVGISIADNKLVLDEPIESIGGCQVPSGLKPLTPKHLLNMEAGFQFVENKNLSVYSGKAWSCAILDLPVEAYNGERFNYGTSQSYLLGSFLEEKTGISLKRYFDKMLFERIGISLKGWRLSPESVPFAGTDMTLTSRDLLAFGQLYLNKGNYDGKQVVPEQWIEKSFHYVWPMVNAKYSYGWYWWHINIADQTFLVAIGYGGQTMFINRELNLIVVTTAPTNKHDERMDYIEKLVEQVVLHTKDRS